MSVDLVALKRQLSDGRRLAAALGLKARRARNANLLVCCPWHVEKEPSCSLSSGPDGTLRVRCFGCGVTGDALTLIAEVVGLDAKREFPAVLEHASRFAGVHAARPLARTAPSADADRAREGVRAIGRLVLNLGRLDAGGASEVDRYLARRGLLDEAAREGLAALPAPTAQAAWAGVVRGAIDGGLVSASGLLRADAFAFAFAEHRLVIPWRTPAGELDTLQRRVLGAGEPRYVFPAGVGPRHPFGVDALDRAATDAPVAFVEGALDVLAARAIYRRAAIDRIVLGLPGASGWQRGWAALARGRAVYLALDADDAGERAVDPIADDLERAGATRVFRARPVGGKDWGALVEARA